MAAIANLAFGTGAIICYRTGQFTVSLEAGSKKKAGAHLRIMVQSGQRPLRSSRSRRSKKEVVDLKP
jgi:spore coat protein U-like protein